MELTNSIKEIIKQVSKKACTYKVAGPTVWERTDSRDMKKFSQGLTLGLEECIRFAEWIEKSYAMVHSDELEKSAWVNAKEETVLVHGSDYHYTTLIKEKGQTTEQLLTEYLKTKALNGGKGVEE